MATVLSYFGTSEKVYFLVQKLSHKTRAYFVNADELKGFLVHGITDILVESERTGKIKEATKYQHVDLPEVLE